MGMGKAFLRSRQAEGYSAGVQQQNMRDWLVIFWKILDNPRSNEVEREQALEDVKRCMQKLSALIEAEGEVYPAWISRGEVNQ